MLGRYIASLEYHNKALAIHEELQHKIEMAGDYRGIGLIPANIGDRKGAIESSSEGLEILKELEEETGYHLSVIRSENIFLSCNRKGLVWQIRMMRNCPRIKLTLMWIVISR
jgi:hypothetical protein